MKSVIILKLLYNELREFLTSIIIEGGARLFHGNILIKFIQPILRWWIN